LVGNPEAIHMGKKSPHKWLKVFFRSGPGLHKVTPFGGFLLSEPPEGLQAPFVFGTTVPQDIQIAIVRPDFVENGLRPIPLIDRFLDHVFPIPELKPHGPFVRLSPRIRLHPWDHSTGLFLVLKIPDATLTLSPGALGMWWRS
jgi:hypothetical protein